MELIFGILGAFVLLGAVVAVFLVISALIALASVFAFQLALGFIALFKAKNQHPEYFVLCLSACFIGNGYLTFYIGKEFFSLNASISSVLLILSSIWFVVYIYLNMPLISPFKQNLEDI